MIGMGVGVVNLSITSLHGADAFRMLAVGFGKLVSKGLTAEEWKRIRLQNQIL